jgi:hypothetical protein
MSDQQASNEPDDASGGRGEAADDVYLPPAMLNSVVRMSLTRRWPVDDRQKRKAVRAVARNLTDSNGRVRNGAARVLVQMERQNQVDQLAAIMSGQDQKPNDVIPLSPAEATALMDLTIPDAATG